MKTVKQIKKDLDTVAQRLCSPELLARRKYLTIDTPTITYEVCLNQENHVVIRIVTMTGAFGENKRVKERKYYSIDYINNSKLENHLLNALTWDGSPFYLKSGTFFKSIEMAG